jgi:hypothetical protein
MRQTNGRSALDAVDQMVWEVVTASGTLAPGPQSGLARLLREGAAGALSGLGAACREPRRQRGLARLADVLHELRRLATWLDLAERFGDLPPDRTLAALQAQGRALAEVEALAAAWRGAEAGRNPAGDEHATREVTPLAATPGGRHVLREPA